MDTTDSIPHFEDILLRALMSGISALWYDLTEPVVEALVSVTVMS